VPCLESDAPVLQSCFSGGDCNFVEFSLECQSCLASDEDEDFCFAPLFEAGLLEGVGGGGPPDCIRDQVDACESGAGRRRVQTGGDAACSMAAFDFMTTLGIKSLGTFFELMTTSLMIENRDAISTSCEACAFAATSDRELFMGCFDYPDPASGQCENVDDESAGCRKCMYSAMKSVCDCETSNCDGCIRSSCFAGGDGPGNDDTFMACLCAMDTSSCDETAMADIASPKGGDLENQCPDAPWAGGDNEASAGDSGYDGNNGTA
jgi:hypothetical protein